MNDLKFGQRARFLLSKPNYRTKLLVFVLIGSLTAVLAARQGNQFWQSVLTNFCVAFTAVAFIQFMWDFLGGDPLDSRISDLEMQMIESISEVRSDMSSLRGSMVVMRDLLDGNLGVERMWPNRRTWQTDHDCGIRCWKDWLCQAKEIKILSTSLWSNWLTDVDFVDRFLFHLERGAHAQIILYHPDSEVLQLRARDEGEIRKGEGVKSEIRASLDRIVNSEVGKELLRGDSKRLEIRLTRDYMHLAQIIQADDRMLVATYLSGRAGGPSPTMQLRGPESSYFHTYGEQFVTVWNRASSPDYAELESLTR